MRILPSALLVAGLLGAPALAQKTDGPSTLSRDWKRLTTPNLTVVGNARDAELRRAATEIERFRNAMVALAPALRLDSPIPLTVVVFRDADAFAPFKPRSARGKVREDIAGYFMPLAHENYIAMAPVASREFTYQLTFHEYTHYIMNRNFKRLPWWLNEGLADFYGTFAGSDRDGRTVIGRPVAHYLRTLRSTPILPLAKFVSPTETAQLFREPEGTMRMYSQSWALTHLLLVGNGGARRDQLIRLIDAVGAGVPGDKAFHDVFGPDLAPLDRELSAYVRQFTLPGILVSGDKVELDVNSTPMTEADALQIQADLLVSMNLLDDAETMLSRALALDHRHPKARLTRARQRVAEDRVADALDIVSADDIAQSPEFGAAFIRAEVLRAKEAYADAITTYRRALALNPESAHAYYGLSLAQLATGDGLAAANFSRCLVLSPAARWYEARQIEAMRLGIDTFVVNDAVNYIRMSGWQGDGGTYVMFPAVLTQLRAGKTAEALETLGEIERNVDRSSWPAAVAALMRGTVTPDALIAKAGRDPGQLTEAHAYAGILASIEGRREDAIRHLEWVMEKGLKNFREHQFAAGELRRLGRPR